MLAISRSNSGFTFGDKETPDDVYFRLRHPEGRYIFAASDVKERQGWVNDFLSAIAARLKFISAEEGSQRRSMHMYRFGEKYKGCYVNGVRDGDGIFRYLNGSEYTGEWTRDCENGTGVLSYQERVPNNSNQGILSKVNVFNRPATARVNMNEVTKKGDDFVADNEVSKTPFYVYDGAFDRGVMRGRCVIQFATGDQYDGDVERGEMHGSGVMRWCCGSVFEGKWSNGAMVEGKLTSADGKQWYEGKFENGRRHGRGVMQYRHGGRYEGSWAFDLKDGVGEYRDAEGSIYTGTWVKGKKVVGTMIYVNGNVYNGEWKGDMREGKGEMKYVTGTVYNGEWVAGQKSGRGVMTFWDGSEFSGHWESDYPSDHGVLTLMRGTKYDGIWKQGRLEGRTIIITPDGVSFNGTVRDGRFTSEGQQTGCFAPIFPRSFSLDE